MTFPNISVEAAEAIEEETGDFVVSASKNGKKLFIQLKGEVPLGVNLEELPFLGLVSLGFARTKGA